MGNKLELGSISSAVNLRQGKLLCWVNKALGAAAVLTAASRDKARELSWLAAGKSTRRKGESSAGVVYGA